jgi:hypothetical protein
LLEAIVIARGLLRDRRWTVSGRLEIFPKSSERQDCVPYRWISQAGLEDLLGFFVTVQLHVEHGFGGEVTIEKVDVLRGDLNEGGPDGL